MKLPKHVTKRSLAKRERDRTLVRPLSVRETEEAYAARKALSNYHVGGYRLWFNRLTTVCRHRHSWIIASGRVEWCYHCGAFRPLRVVGPAASSPISEVAGPWVRPTGPDGENPWETCKKNEEAWLKRMTTKRKNRK